MLFISVTTAAHLHSLASSRYSLTDRHCCLVLLSDPEPQQQAVVGETWSFPVVLWSAGWTASWMKAWQCKTCTCVWSVWYKYSDTQFFLPSTCAFSSGVLLPLVPPGFVPTSSRWNLEEIKNGFRSGWTTEGLCPVTWNQQCQWTRWFQSLDRRSFRHFLWWTHLTTQVKYIKPVWTGSTDWTPIMWSKPTRHLVVHTHGVEFLF